MHMEHPRHGVVAEREHVVKLRVDHERRLDRPGGGEDVTPLDRSHRHSRQVDREPLARRRRLDSCAMDLESAHPPR